MDVLAYSCLVGFGLALAHLLCHAVRGHCGARHAQWCWLALVGLPLTTVGFISVPLLLLGLAFGYVTSALATVLDEVVRKAIHA